MFLDINEIRGEGRSVPVDCRFGSDELARAAEPGARPLAAVIEGRVDPAAVGVDLSGAFRARVRLECSRCLAGFEAALNGEVRLSLVGVARELGSGEIQLGPDDAGLFYCPDGKADLSLLVAEQISLALPLKPVCGEDCRGLCPACGGNRNEIECGCRSDIMDPRLAPLLEIRDKLGGS